jgi:hypothetical protein
VEQAHAHVLLQLAHGLADRLRRETGVQRRTAEAPGPRHGDKEGDDTGSIHQGIYNQKLKIKRLSYG